MSERRRDEGARGRSAGVEAPERRLAESSVGEAGAYVRASLPEARFECASCTRFGR